MSIDIYHSRRINFSKCIYWLRDERDSIASSNKWIANNKPSGTFYARQISPYSKNINQVSGVMMFDRNNIAIETDDDIKDITVNAIIKYRGEIWIVENIQAEPHQKESQFSKSIHYKYTLSLRR